MKSDLQYERMARGELPVESGDGCPARLAELRAADAAFLRKHPPALFAAEVESRVRRRLARGAALTAGALAACLSVAVMLPSLSGREDGTRMKGSDLNLFLYHKTEAGTELLPQDTSLSEGDVVQVSYFARGRSYAVILSVDGLGRIMRHMPLHGPDALLIDTERYEVLPYAYTLDDAPAFEDLYLIVSPEPFKVDEATAFLQAGFDSGTPNIQLPAPFRYAAIRINKSEVRE